MHDQFDGFFVVFRKRQRPPNKFSVLSIGFTVDRVHKTAFNSKTQQVRNGAVSVRRRAHSKTLLGFNLAQNQEQIDNLSD